jgi:CMP-N-acetylneuraminic acid synthetase
MKTLAIIPARGASKRVPDKNTRNLLGKPLIAWSIEAARASGIAKIIVTTDSEEIATIARTYGAEVPFIRPAELAEDTTAIEPVLIHALEEVKKTGFEPDSIILLMPPTPMRNPAHIKEALALFKNTNADSVVSVIPATANKNPLWILKRDKSGKVILWNDQPLKEIIPRSQDQPVCYSRNDVLYILKPSNLYETPPNLYGDEVELYIMNESFDLDINTESDFLYAETKMRLFLKGKIG